MRNGIATPYVSNQVAGDLMVQGGNLRLPSINSQSNFVQKTDENGRKLYTPSGNIIFDTESPYSVPMDFQAFKAELTPFVLRKKTSGLQQTQQTGIYD